MIRDDGENRDDQEKDEDCDSICFYNEFAGSEEGQRNAILTVG